MLTIMKKLWVLGVAALLALSGCKGNKTTETGKELETTAVVVTEETSQAKESGANMDQTTDLEADTNSSLAPYAYKVNFDEIDKTLIPDFLEGDLRDLYCTAFKFEADGISISSRFPGSDFSSTFEKDGGLYTRTGCSYESYCDFLYSVFTKEKADEFLSSETIINENGEVCYMDAARGSNICYKDGQFELISKTEDEIKFKYIAHYSYEGIMTEEEFNEMNEGGNESYSWDEEFIISIVNTDEGWRVDEFNLWF